MRFTIVLTLAACAVLAIFNSNLFAKTSPAIGLHSTQQGSIQKTPCLNNLNAGLVSCDAANETQQQMVFIRGQLLPVDHTDNGT